MIYLLLPRGTLDWDDVRIFTSFSAVERLITASTYVIGYEGIDELKPVWIYQLESGTIRRYALSSPSLSES